jgi:hypothetical protein
MVHGFAESTEAWRGWVPYLARHFRAVRLDLHAAVQQVRRPTLTTTTGLRTVEGVRAWQSQMRDSRLLVLESDAWHAAGALPDECAKAAADFLAQLN